MNKNIDSFPFYAETFLADSKSRMRPSNICSSMLNFAYRHADARGFGATSSLGWVIARMGVHIERVPLEKEKLYIDTWIRNLYHGFTDRCVRMTDEAGNRILTFPVGEDVTLYAFRAPRNTYMRVRFSGGEQCTPLYLSWTEERVVCHNQTLLTANELRQGYADTLIQQAFDNEFANLQLYCISDYGTVVTDPITFVLD